MDYSYPIGNNHGGLVCVNDKWYVFDHRMTNGSQFSRQGVAERIRIKEDGTIDMVEATSCGLNNGPLKGQGQYPAYICCNLVGTKRFGFRSPVGGPKVTQDGEDYEPQVETAHEVTAETETNAPVAYIADMSKGSQAGFKYFDLTDTTYVVVETRNAKGKMQILNGLDGKVIAEGKLNDSSNWSKTKIDFDPTKIVNGNNKNSLQKCPLFFRYWGKGAIEFLGFELG